MRRRGGALQHRELGVHGRGQNPPARAQYRSDGGRVYQSEKLCAGVERRWFVQHRRGIQRPVPASCLRGVGAGLQFLRAESTAMKPLRSRRNRSGTGQRGTVLFIALIFLILLTVMALTTFNLSKGTQQIVGNMAVRSQAFQVALQTSEAAISTNRLVHHPTDLFGSGANTVAVDVNGDHRTVINATVDPPQCISIK